MEHPQCHKRITMIDQRHRRFGKIMILHLRAEIEPSALSVKSAVKNKI